MVAAPDRPVVAKLVAVSEDLYASISTKEYVAGTL